MTLELINNKFTNAQIEVLNLMAFDLTEEEIKRLKQLILKFKAERLTTLVDEHFEKTGLNPDDMLNEKLRINSK